MITSPFSARVRDAFSRRVASYEPRAALQRGMAWRLAGVARHALEGRAGERPALVLPEGPCADLGAGTGLLGRALATWSVPLPEPLEQLDLCPEALARNGSGPPFAWDLNQGLPPHLSGAALLASSFALQWLDPPAEALRHWGERLAPGGWLLLSVPTAGSFPEWRQAAQRSGLPCSALPLPAADGLFAAAARAGLETLQARRLTFSGIRPASRHPASGTGSPEAAGTAALPSAPGRAAPAGARRPAAPAATPAHPALEALRALGAIGANATPRATSLSPGDWRRLLAAWPAGGHLSWEVLLLLARKPSGGRPCDW